MILDGSANKFGTIHLRYNQSRGNIRYNAATSASRPAASLCLTASSRPADSPPSLSRIPPPVAGARWRDARPAMARRERLLARRLPLGRQQLGRRLGNGTGGDGTGGDGSVGDGSGGGAKARVTALGDGSGSVGSGTVGIARAATAQGSSSSLSCPWGRRPTQEDRPSSTLESSVATGSRLSCI